METIHCVNCGANNAYVSLGNEHMLSVIRQWTAPQLVNNCDHICESCWTLVNEFIQQNNPDSIPIVDKQYNCVLCQRSMAIKTRSHQILKMRTDTQHHQNIQNIVSEWLIPRQICSSDHICHPCWQKADRAAKHYSRPSSSTTTMTSSAQMIPLHCINCGLNIERMKRHILDNENILSLVQRRIAPRTVSSDNYICNACFNSCNRVIAQSQDQNISISETVGHHNLCLGCGHRLTQNVRCHQLRSDTELGANIRQIVAEWISPREIQPSDQICHSCWQRAYRAQEHAQEPAQEPAELPIEQHVQNIILPNFARAADTQARCIFTGCRERQRLVVPFCIRVQLLKDFKFYVPPNCRICGHHLRSNTWADLLNSENVICSFSATYIEDFYVLLNNESILDFENINEMDGHLVWYWFGLSKEQFNQVLAQIPDFHRKSTAVSAYFLKLRTGDSDQRISSLFNIPRTTLARLMSQAREKLVQYFVPLHLGINHMTRQEIAERNLLIPNGLFGNPNSPIEDRKAIVIFDGTYIYIQKSANYFYQKQTYSLHKYRNLVKPFMIVCCDGYIVDVLGPYPAITSDAEIMLQEFYASSRPLRQYFREGDVFVLDRGFRDSVTLLQDCNYSVHLPISLQEGETQMSTLNANKSRAVTICRWVVEVVNGRFKRDYKLFRQEYFNKASNHLMQDFSVAAALINSFHPPITDREDAQQILVIMGEKMFCNNLLADYVIENNINRRRAQFMRINVENNNVTDFPRLTISEMILISLGTYQLKQAYSYYGEHIRRNGSYTIEVCREVDCNLQHISSSNNAWLLRGRIQSRHIGHKTYLVYILVNGCQSGRDGIKQYYCNCIAGRRTVGCCAHVMTIIWYLGWARFQPHISPPAQFLDDVLVCYDAENI